MRERAKGCEIEALFTFIKVAPPLVVCWMSPISLRMSCGNEHRYVFLHLVCTAALSVIFLY